MSYVVSLVDYTPVQRYDGLPWITARIEESDAEAGPTWAAIDTITLSPVDTDPANPLTRTLTTHNATLEHGWYRVVWIDAAARQSVTPAVQNIDDTVEYQPLVTQVAKLLRARTRDTNGNLLGEFTAVTQPTYEQALELVGTATDDVVAAVGQDIPDSLRRPAASVTALLAAMYIELSYFPEQVATGRSPYAQYERLYEAQLKRLIDAIKRLGADAELGTADDLSTSGMPSFYFPDLGGNATHAPGSELPQPIRGWMDW